MRRSTIGGPYCRCSRGSNSRIRKQQELHGGSANEIISLPAGTTDFTVIHLFPTDPTSTSTDTYRILVTVEDDDTGSITSMTTAKVGLRPDDWFRLSAGTDSLETLYEILAFESIKVRDTDGENDTAVVSESYTLDLVLGTGWE